LKQVKTAFRRQLRNLYQRKSTQEESALNTVLSLFLKNKSGTWAAYKALPNECAIDTAVDSSTHLLWLYPKVKDRELEFFAPGAQGFESGKFGIDEPVLASAQKVAFDKISGALVPGLAFDIKGNRLGQGHGFYDRVLENWNGIKVGIALSHQIFPEIAAEGHDQKMDYVVTPVGVIGMNEKRLSSWK
jgi:5,10-methenyltetrahydrofolate synthetase